jgi:hypothetical protein
MTSLLRASSDVMRCSKSSGVVSRGSNPGAENRSRMSGRLHDAIDLAVHVVYHGPGGVVRADDVEPGHDFEVQNTAFGDRRYYWFYALSSIEACLIARSEHSCRRA